MGAMAARALVAQRWVKRAAQAGAQESRVGAGARAHPGSTVRMLNLIGACSRERLTICCERSWTCAKAISALAEVMVMKSAPEHIRPDNGPEFVAREF